MSLHARKPLVVLFALGAVALGVLMVYNFGGREIFTRHDAFLIYFGDSLNGLESGAVVKFKGVPVGYVDSIKLNYRESTADRRMPVVVEINADRLQHNLGVLEDVGDPAVLARLVQRGFRAEMDFDSYITGGMYVELDFHPNVPPPPKSYAPRGVAVIPTVPSQAVSDLGKVQQTIEWLPTFDFQGEIAQAGEFLDALTTKVAVIPYAEYSRNLSRSLQPMVNLDYRNFQRNLNLYLARLDRYQGAIANANDQFSSSAQDFVGMNQVARQNLAQVDADLATLRETFNPQAPWLAHLTDNFAQFSKDMDKLSKKTDALEQQPALVNKLSK